MIPPDAAEAGRSPIAGGGIFVPAITGAGRTVERSASVGQSDENVRDRLFLGLDVEVPS